MSNKSKNDTLGMPHGTAVGRLRKNLLFSLLKKLGEDTCFKCDLKIEHVEQLSIEHIKPWEGVSSDLFWDLDNITFSHLSCNCSSRRNSSLARKNPEGKNWCYICKAFKDRSEFYAEPSRKTGLNNLCKSCKSIQGSFRDRRK